MSTETSEVTTNENVSHVQHPPFSESYWIFSEIVIAVSMFFSIYILLCLARYASVTRCRPGREISGRKGKVLYRMCLMSVVMAVARFISDQVSALIGWQTDTLCLVTVSVSTVFYALSLYPVYFFLWMRQSIFYANPVLAHVLNPVVTVISYATLFVMLGTGSVLIIVYVIPETTGWNFTTAGGSCRETSSESKRGGFDVVPLLVVCFSTAFQLSLLALFIYPLLTRKTQRYRSSDPSSNHSIQGGQNRRLSDSETYCNSHVLAAEQSNYEVIPDKEQVQLPRHSPASIQTNSKYTHETDEKDPKKPMHFIKMMRKVSADDRRPSGSSTLPERRSKTQQGRRVIRFIRKAFVLSLICVVSDIIVTVAQLILQVPEIVYLAIFDINLLVNILCIIMSFRDWPNMILPMCTRIALRRRSSTAASSAAYAGRTNSTKFIVTMAQCRRERNGQLPMHGNGEHLSSSNSQNDSNGAGKGSSNES